jgi:hypothetical protein
METEVQYPRLKPNTVSRARTLCEKLNEAGTPQRKVLLGAEKINGAQHAIFAVLALGNDGELAITIIAENVERAIANFQAATDADSLELRDMLNTVLETPIERDRCPRRHELAT